jgi:dTDP-glucose pyrophosphorylase
MLDLEQFIIPSSWRIRDAMQRIEEMIDDFSTLYVIDEDRKLIGTLTDSDIRRALIHDNVSNNDLVTCVAHAHPKILRLGQKNTREEIKSLYKYRFLPIVDDSDHLLGFKRVSDLTAHQNRVVLMAGGLGSRLHPLTAQMPKPMLKVGNKPIIQTIIEQFRSHQFNTFTISVNYMSNIITDYLGDGEAFDIHIDYVHETKKLGTAGSLSLLSPVPAEPFFVMNGDILTNVNFEEMLAFHLSGSFEATMCAIEYGVDIPYGVLETQGNSITAIHEKPTKKYQISAGIYLLNPSVIKHIPRDEVFDMPQLLRSLINQGEKVGMYQLKDYWMDIGHPEDFQKANHDYLEYFGEKQ